MNWELPGPFVIDIEVTAEDIDGLGHANNAVYVLSLIHIFSSRSVQALRADRKVSGL